jgi:hypothetical protein
MDENEMSDAYSAIDYNILTNIFNELFEFKSKFMPEDSLLDTLIEFASKNNYNPFQLAQELGDSPGFRDIVEKDCIKFKYYKGALDKSSDEWS